MPEPPRRTDAGRSEGVTSPQSTSGALDWLFRNRQTGSITVAQVPNLPMWIFLASVLLRWTVSGDAPLGPFIEGIALASLSWWAFLEVRWGVNPWRRLLGVGGVAIVIAGAASHL
jgi:hypothetical protein